MNTRQYDEAVSQYSIALSLDPPTSQILLVKRSKARAGMGSWQDTLDDADEVPRFCPIQDRPF